MFSENTIENGDRSKGNKRRKKRVYWGYSMLDYKGMEAYFEEMARKGWMLEKIGEVWATFYKDQPKNLQFTIDIFEGSGVLTPEETEETKEYRELCEKNGWHFLASIKELQIFFAPKNLDLTPLQTDEELEENLVRKKVWKKDFAINIITLIVTLGLVMFSRLRPSWHMDDYVGNMIYYIYPFMLLPAGLSFVSSILWMRKVKEKGLPEKNIENFFSGRKRKLIVDITAVFILAVLIMGIVLDTIYNPHRNTLSSMFPVFLGLSIGTILRILIRKKGRKKDDGIKFLVVGFIIMFLILGAFNHIRSENFKERLGEGDFNRWTVEEAPEGIEFYSLEPTLLVREDVQIRRRVFREVGQSFAVPNYYKQVEIWEGNGEEWGIVVKTYETRGAGVAEKIKEGYLNFQIGGLITYISDSWIQREELQEAWEVDHVSTAEDYPGILVRKKERIWFIEGSPNTRLEEYLDIDLLVQEILLPVFD